MSSAQRERRDFVPETALEELAQLVAAIPPAFRATLVRAAFKLDPTGDFETSYLIGELRAAIWRCLELAHVDWDWAEIGEFARQRAVAADEQIESLNTVDDAEAMQGRLRFVLRLTEDGQSI